MSAPSGFHLMLGIVLLGMGTPCGQFREWSLSEDSATSAFLAPLTPAQERPAYSVSVRTPPPLHPELGSSLPSQWAGQRDRLEDLILALAAEVSWEHLSILATSVYPELRDDLLRLHPAAIQQPLNPIRAARERYRLRQFLTEAALLDYREYPAL